jgi:hypothetical protein
VKPFSSVIPLATNEDTASGIKLSVDRKPARQQTKKTRNHATIIPGLKEAGSPSSATEQFSNMGKKNSTLGRLDPCPDIIATEGIPSVVQL